MTHWTVRRYPTAVAAFAVLTAARAHRSSPFQVWVRARFLCLGCGPDWRRARGPDSWTVRESQLRCARSHRLLVDGVQLLFDG
jgi:hypothetical protein